MSNDRKKRKSGFADPTSDWGFKRAFVEEPTGIVRESFMKAVFPKLDITKVGCVHAEQLGLMEDDRKGIFDMICLTHNGEAVIVEMQRKGQRNIMERALYYSAFPLIKQGVKGKWDYSLKGIYIVNILCFRYMDDNRVIHRFQLRDELGTIGTSKFEIVLIELSKFSKEIGEIHNPLEMWLFGFKNMAQLDNIPPEIMQEQGIKEFFEREEYLRMDDREYNECIDNMVTISEKDYDNQINYAWEEGSKEGQREGERLGILNSALKMLQAGVNIDLISNTLGISKEVLLKKV